MSNVTPIVKWAGGKRQLLSEIMPLIPDDIEVYYEPFLGAGAVLFELLPERAIVNDLNSELINLFQVVKDEPQQLIRILRQYEKHHSTEQYYEIRDKDRNPRSFTRMGPVRKAARTLYLNRTCFNGLYRVNRHGYFNTPIGRNSKITICNKEDILSMSDYLNTADIALRNEDYRLAIAGISPRDFVFFDPPYYPINHDSFLRYDANHFDILEQQRLKEVCDDLTNRGIRFMETNTDCEEIRTLYHDYNIIEVEVRRSINADPNGRNGTEVIITNY